MICCRVGYGYAFNPHESDHIHYKSEQPQWAVGHEAVYSVRLYNLL